MRFKDFIKQDSTLELHKNLNSKFWDNNNKLEPEIRKKLISLAMYWADYAKIPQKYIKDIIFTGGNANYNYTSTSDIDIHLLINKDKLDCKDFIDEYILDKKNLWSTNHDIKIKGYPVELFAQDKDQPTPADQGVYSLLNNSWITKPKKEFVNVKSKSFKLKLKHFIELINFFINNKVKDLDAIQKLKDRIRLYRSAGLKAKGEYSFENLIFKELRNLGYIDKLGEYFDKVVDQKFSI